MTAEGSRTGGTVECADCHRVYEPTPLNDIYEPAWGGPKVCYGCLINQWNRRGGTDG